MKIQKKKKLAGGGGGLGGGSGRGVRLVGCQGGCDRIIEIFRKI